MEHIEIENDELGLNRLLSSMKMVSDEEAATRRRDALRRERSEKTEVLRQSWGAPKRHAQAKVEIAGPFAIALEKVAGKIGKGIIAGVCGTRGSGKTQLAVEMMKVATESQISARYITAVDLFMRLKATFRRDSAVSERDVVAEMRKPGLLVIDEVGKRGQSDWENNLLFELVNDRYNDMTDTILIANLAPADFGAAVGQSISSRINETGGVIHADWPSRRG